MSIPEKSAVDAQPGAGRVAVVSIVFCCAVAISPWCSGCDAGNDSDTVRFAMRDNAQLDIWFQGRQVGRTGEELCLSEFGRDCTLSYRVDRTGAVVVLVNTEHQIEFRRAGKVVSIVLEDFEYSSGKGHCDYWLTSGS